MPGILPMKVIKVGTSSQSRIAQACDRCRSKKIRCDGIRPCCSQCANVGFECRTSDKLSRRAFPRGYTESLEERVRVLEAEVRELKDLLDEKDEKIDMLSKIHGNRQSSSTGGVNGGMSSASSPAESRSGKEPTPPKEDTFRVQASPLLLGVENSDSYFMGASSGRGFIESFKRRMQETGKPCSDFHPEAFLHIQGCPPLAAKPPSPPRIPPRLFSDRCVNVYFQEWAPLFPVLHKPTFLRVYEEFVADPDKIKNNHKLAQLYLVFSVAALSSDRPDLEQIAACEQQWHQSLEAILMDNTMITLQCLVLALMYCTARADYKRLQHYKGIAVGLSHRLGLHQSQKRFSFGALTIETRKKVFWTLYTLDCFSAAILGLPKLLKEEDIHAEYPSDTDDEYVTEKGFQPTLPGEYTRLSSALALFRAARILSKVLAKNYPAATTQELSLQQMSGLEAELDDWSENLPQHLKLTFKQDKPSTDITGSRSPLLALAYYYIRTLIYRPAVGSSLGPKAAPALISIGESSKHLVQIVQLLEERSMSFSFCLNKTDLLVLCGMTLLYQNLGLKQDSKMSKDNEKLANAVVTIVERTRAPGSHEFKRIAGLLVALDEPQQLPTPPRLSPDTSMAAPPLQRASPPAPAERKSKLKSPVQQQYALGRHAGASMSETDLLVQQEKLRRMTVANIPPTPRPEAHRSGSRSSFDNPRPDPAMLFQQQQRRDHRLSMSQAAMIGHVSSAQNSTPNLDYLPLSNTPPSHSNPSSPIQNRLPQHGLPTTTTAAPQQAQLYTAAAQQVPRKAPGGGGGVSSTEWEALLGQIDGGQVNLYDAIYGGQPVSLDTPAVDHHQQQQQQHQQQHQQHQHQHQHQHNGWPSPDAIDLSGFNLGDFGGPGAGTAQSVLSLSDESLSSVSNGEDAMAGPLDFRDYNPRGAHRAAIMTADGFILDGLDGNFGL